MSMQRPQLVQLTFRIVGPCSNASPFFPVPAPGMIPFKAGLITWGSGQTLKQSRQSLHFSRRAASTRSRAAGAIKE